MISNAKSVATSLRRCALLFLALSVFCFGLHAKLEAYHRTAPNLSDSKISTGKSSVETLRALDKQVPPSKDAHKLICGSPWPAFHAAVALPPAVKMAQIELSDPRRLDLNSVYSLHGPPSTNL